MDFVFILVILPILRGRDMKRLFIIMLVFSLALSFNCVYSDMTFIPTDFVNVYEPLQLAIISWNDGTEVMLFGVNMRIVTGIRGIGLMPLPSKPEVYLGSIESIKIVSGLFEEAAESTLGPVLGVHRVFNVVLGPHNVTCLRIEANASSDEIRAYLFEIARENDLGYLAVTNSHIELIKLYASMGYNYFLVDIINSENSVSGFLPPLIVKFKAPKVWYPLKISSLYNGSMRIGILVVTPRNFVYEGDFEWDIAYKKIVSRDYISKIDPRLLSVFSVFDRWFNIYVYGEYFVVPEDLNFDFEGHIAGMNVNIYYYSILIIILMIIVIGLIPSIKIPTLNEKTKVKIKKMLLLSAHIVGAIVIWVVLLSGVLFMPILDSWGEEAPLYVIYAYSSIGLLVTLVVLLTLILNRVVGYLRTRDVSFLTKKGNGILFLTIHVSVILLIVAGVTAFFLNLEGPWYISQTFLAMLTACIMYLATLYFINIITKKK